MNTSILFFVPGWIIAIAIFLLILILNRLGFQYRKREIKRNPELEGEGLGTAEGSMLGLLALLLAFTFNMAAHKYEIRREIIIEEANAIGTAIHRCDLYPDSIKKEFRKEFAKYLDARIAYFNAGTDEKMMESAIHEAESCSGRIWRIATNLAQDRDNFVRSAQMIPALNAMIDIVHTRDDSRKAKVPPLIMLVLLVFILVSAFLSGYGNKTRRRNRVMITAFAFMTTITLYLVLELDRPRSGLITLEPAEQKIVDLKRLLVEEK